MTNKLRSYQTAIGAAILDSILHRKGLTFSVEIARQGGKNELSAQIEVLLLTLFAARGGNGVKGAPTFKPQTIISMQRLRERLNDAGFSDFWVSEHGYIIRLGRARQLFLSADRSSHVVGATAHILLEIDEAQDVAKDKFAKEFKPMGAATNVTTVLYGTPWDDSTLLEETKQVNLELERKDGIRRHFSYDWQEVAKHNPDYLAYVEGERQRLGESHPLFLTQYCLRPLAGGGGFLSGSQRAQLQGSHARRRRPSGGKQAFVAGIDIAGQAEEGEDAALRALKPRQDSTVVTIGGLDYSVCDAVVRQPRLLIVEHRWWTGKPHASLYPQLLDVLKNVWGCSRVVVDSTGVGQGVASFLESSLGKSAVVPFQFTQSSKSKLGFGLLAAVNAGRVKMYSADGSPEYQQFWWEMEHARSAYRPNQTVNFFVDPAEGHDDFLMSLALAVEAAQGYEPRRAKGHVREADM
ncbi:MAG: hypothetical protein HY671_00075 [Chloroflexi bacterium]|nr:hypothetical protein [Chloroflexota bacterium]